jgi:DNA-binding response OmpR family regulator
LPLVLIVGSDARALRLLEVGLRQAGYRVVTVDSSAAALQVAEAQRPTVALIDVDLHDGDGFGLAGKLREKPGCERLLVLFLVEPRRPSDRLRAMEIGGSDVLDKPVYLKEALWRVETLLEKAAQRGELGGGKEGTARFSGVLSGTTILDLLQSMELAKKSGLVHCQNARGQRGSLYLHDGKAIDAEVGRLRGEAALYRLITWRDGEYRVDLIDVLRPARITENTSSLILEAARRFDEWNSLCMTLPPLDSVLLSAAGTTLDGLTPSDNLPAEMQDILAAFNGSRTIQDVVELDEELPLSDIGRLEVISRLFAERRLVSLTPHLTPRRPTLTPAPVGRLTPSPWGRLTPPPAPRLTPPPLSFQGSRWSSPGVPQAPSMQAPPAARPTPAPMAPMPTHMQTQRFGRLTPAPMAMERETALAAQPAAPKQPRTVEHSQPTVRSLEPLTASPALASTSLPKLEVQPSASDSYSSLPLLSSDLLKSSASSISSLSALPELSAELLPVDVSLSSSADLKPPIHTGPPPPRPAESSPGWSSPAFAPPRPEATAPDRQPSQILRHVLTLLIGVGLFCVGMGLYWVVHTLTRSADAPPATPAQAATEARTAPSPAAPEPAQPTAPAPSAPAAPASPAPEATASAPAASPSSPTPPPEEPGAATAAAAAPEVEPPPAPLHPTPETPPVPAAGDARYDALIGKARTALRRGQTSLAKHSLREAMKLRPQAASALILQGELLLDEGDADGAARLAKKALQLDATAADAHIVLGMAAQARAQMVTARTHFKKYLELAPSGDRVKDVKAILRSGY